MIGTGLNDGYCLLGIIKMGDEKMADISGTSGPDTLIGTSGSDVISGLSGDDLINGLDGSDTLSGGEGSDIFRYESLSALSRWYGGIDGLHETILDFGFVGSASGPAVDILDFSEIAGFTFIGDGGFSATGRSEYRFNLLNNGALFQFDQAGDGTPDHYLVIDQITAEASFEGAFVDDPVETNQIIAPDLNYHYLVGTAQADQLIGSSQDERLSGLEGDDRLYGHIGADELRGGSGADVLDGGQGADVLIGGAGNDIYYVDTEFDDVYEVAQGGHDKINSSADFLSVKQEVEDIALFGSGRVAIGNALDNLMNGNQNDNILAGAGGSDVLSGGGGRDELSGGLGNDWIRGGSGADVLQGDLGADKFVYFSIDEIGKANSQQDIIVDFTGSNITGSSATADRIDLHRIDANRTTIADDAFRFIGASAFSGEAGELRYALGSATVDDVDPVNGRPSFQAPALQLEGDTDGDGLADFQLALLSTSQINATDFFL